MDIISLTQMNQFDYLMQFIIFKEEEEVCNYILKKITGNTDKAENKEQFHRMVNDMIQTYRAKYGY